MLDNKAFLFLYPQEDIFDFEIRNYSWSYESLELDMEFEARKKSAVSSAEIKQLQEQNLEESAKLFRPIYSKALNQAIDTRYRKKGFCINYALLNDTQISSVIQLQTTDKIIYVGMDAQTHRALDESGKGPHPDRDFILDGLGDISKLVVCGFHLNSCVKELARRSYIRGIDVLVDEELTELFGREIQRPEFDPSTYPGINIRSLITDPKSFKIFNQRRSKQPWLYNWEQ